MTDAELYPRLTALGVRSVRDDPDSPPGVDWREVNAAVMRRLSWTLIAKWERWKNESTCGANGLYAGDVERFLGGLPKDD